MRARIKSYPIPVLGNQDDVEGHFNPTISYTLEPRKVIIRCALDVSNPTIEGLLKAGAAQFFIQIECSSTFFRRTYTTNDTDLIIELDAGDVRDRVVVRFYICAVRTIGDYDPAGVHPDLAGELSEVEPGDVLADGGQGSFVADKTFDPLKAPISSFMKIKEGSFASGSLTVEYDNESILIVLSKADFKDYKYVRKYAVSSIHSALVLPVLIDVLHVMRTHKNEYADHTWFARIEQICAERKINIEDPIEAAQQLLGEPISRAIEELKSKISEDN